MATTNSYYINGPSLASATAVFTNSDLTIKAPDGWYAFEGIVRQQVGGILLPEQNCNGDFIPISISVVSVTSTEACGLELTTYCYNDPVVPGGVIGLITVGDTVYSDYCAQELLADGYYNATGYIQQKDFDWFKVIDGIVTEVGFCDIPGKCKGYLFELSNPEGNAGSVFYTDCSGQSFTVSLNEQSPSAYACMYNITDATVVSGSINISLIGNCVQ